MFKKSLALAAAAVVAGVMALNGVSTANAAPQIFIPRMHGGMMMHHPMMQGPMMNNRTRGMHSFDRGDSDWWRRHHRHDRDFAFLGLGFPGYYDDYYDDDYYYPSYSYGYGGNAHVQWCLNRYRTYDPRTNTFIGSDGYRHACVGYY